MATEIIINQLLIFGLLMVVGAIAAKRKILNDESKDFLARIIIDTLLSDKNSNWVFRFCKTLNINMYYLIFFGLLKVSPPKIENIATHFAALFANLCLDFRENSADEYN